MKKLNDDDEYDRAIEDKCCMYFVSAVCTTVSIEIIDDNYTFIDDKDNYTTQLTIQADTNPVKSQHPPRSKTR